MNVDISHDIAIIGMAGRFPGALTIEEFWTNLSHGYETITHYSDDDLLAAGVDPIVLQDPHYVKAKGILTDAELFDASFFGYLPREAGIIDPQQRLFLECAWEALEGAGYDSLKYDGRIGVFAGAGYNSYLISKILPTIQNIASFDAFSIRMGNENDHLATRVSYKLNLQGPSINVQSSCSTSLVAIHYALQSLLNGECDMALAGGVSVSFPQRVGYNAVEGSPNSLDGHCRAFDVHASGTVLGEGVGIVVLKRLEDALRDNDTIRAVIRGSAVNNDGAQKVGYTAPGLEGQTSVIIEAQMLSGVSPETISYVEAHGTATILGDPIEIAALTQAFQTKTAKTGYCALGSVKTNIGHLNAAAGVAGLIKTVLALEHRKIPPSLHFTTQNPHINFAQSPFYVNTALCPWETSDGKPRRAAVSSFGIGGTNAHVIVEEAPARPPSGPSRPAHLLILSAKTSTALDAMATRLANYLQTHPEVPLADVAYTLQVGRQHFPYRQMLVCESTAEAATALMSPMENFSVGHQDRAMHEIVFLLPGQGMQAVGMGGGLYQHESVFRDVIDTAATVLTPSIGGDLRTLLYPSDSERATAEMQMELTRFAQPALFAVEYALAQLWQSWGVKPTAMIGHSLGEYVAACLAGVLSFEEALLLVAARGELMASCPTGAMMAVFLAQPQLEPLLGEELSIAAINGPTLCTVSGPISAIATLEQHLLTQGIRRHRLSTSHAFHSAMMEPIMSTFETVMRRVHLRPPELPFLSNVTGTWITATQATDPQYWVQHLRQPVEFATGIRQILTMLPNAVFIEVGPGRSLESMSRMNSIPDTNPLIFPSLPGSTDTKDDLRRLWEIVGQLWLGGVQLNWEKMHQNESRHRLLLPTYPFERQHYSVNPPSAESERLSTSSPERPRQDQAEWLYAPVWIQRPVDEVLEVQPQRWLLFTDSTGAGAQLTEWLRDHGQHVCQVQLGTGFTRFGSLIYEINPQQQNDYLMLLDDLYSVGFLPERVVHCWSIPTSFPTQSLESELEAWETYQPIGFSSLLYFVQALDKVGVSTPIQINCITTEVFEVNGEEPLCPAKATLLGLCRVIPQEYPLITCRVIDFVLPTDAAPVHCKLIARLGNELLSEVCDTTVAYRGQHRWVQTYTHIHLAAPQGIPARLRPGSVYIITGGLGEIGLTVASYLAATVQAKLVLIGRSPLPAKNEWDSWLASHPKDELVCAKIRMLQAIENSRSEVLVLQADVTDPAQMRSAVKQAEAHFGEINGVVHAAGVSRDNLFQFINDSDNNFYKILYPKVRGTIILSHLLKGINLDFFILVSSLASVLGGIGFAAYAAATSFMDLFSRQIQDQNIISINLDGVRTTNPMSRSANHDQLKIMNSEEISMSGDEMIHVFASIISGYKRGQIVVSIQRIEKRIQSWVNKVNQYQKPQISARSEMTKELSRNKDHILSVISSIWRDLFGLDSIDVNDNFLVIGGNSLYAIQLLSRLQQTFDGCVSLRDVFENLTIDSQATMIINNSVSHKGISSKNKTRETACEDIPIVSNNREQGVI